MKAIWLAIATGLVCTLAHAEDMADTISRYRREHGLSTVKMDPQLTAIAERHSVPDNSRKDALLMGFALEESRKVRRERADDIPDSDRELIALSHKAAQRRKMRV
jgi:hypothetical protein